MYFLQIWFWLFFPSALFTHLKILLKFGLLNKVEFVGYCEWCFASIRKVICYILERQSLLKLKHYRVTTVSKIVLMRQREFVGHKYLSNSPSYITITIGSSFKKNLAKFKVVRHNIISSCHNLKSCLRNFSMISTNNSSGTRFCIVDDIYEKLIMKYLWNKDNNFTEQIVTDRTDKATK